MPEGPPNYRLSGTTKTCDALITQLENVQSNKNKNVVNTSAPMVVGMAADEDRADKDEVKDGEHRIGDCETAFDNPGHRVPCRA